MEWYSKCARVAFEQVAAGGSPATFWLTRPGGYVCPEPHAGPCNAASTRGCRQGKLLASSRKASIVTIATLVADSFFIAPDEHRQIDAANQSKQTKPKGTVLATRTAANFLDASDAESSLLQDLVDRIVLEVSEKSSKYKDRGLVLAADYKYKLDQYLEAKKIELGNYIRAEFKIAREAAYLLAQDLFHEAKLMAHDVKEKAIVSAENYTTIAKTYAAEKGDELSEKLKEDLRYRQEIAKEWANELAVVAKEKSIAASKRGYFLAEAFVVVVKQKSIEATVRGFILAEEFSDQVSLFVVEKGSELADKIRKEMKNTASFVEESANELVKEVSFRANGKLSLKEFDEGGQKRSSLEKRTIEKAEQLQAELNRSAEIAQKWAEDLAADTKKLSEKIKKEDLIIKTESEMRKTLIGAIDSLSQKEAETRAKAVFAEFQKEMQTSAELVQKWAAELAEETNKQADITNQRGKELLEKLRKELEMSKVRTKEFCESSNYSCLRAGGEIREWCKHQNCQCELKSSRCSQEGIKGSKNACKCALRGS